MIYRIFIILTFFIASINCLGQSVTWQRVLNNNYGSIAKVQQTSDGGYIAVGNDYINSTWKMYLTKFDYLGNSLWTKIIGTGTSSGYWIEETTDEGFIIAGDTDSGGANLKAYLVKTDSLGNIQWQKTYSISDLDGCYCVKQTIDGGYILACRTFPYRVGTWYIKTTDLGNILWQKVFYDTNYFISAFSELQILNYGYISIGSKSSVMVGNNDVYVMKLNLTGDTLWTKTFGGNSNDGGRSIDKVGNSGFIVGGRSSSFNLNNYETYVIRIDTNGSVLWQRTYSGIYSEECKYVRYRPNVGFVMAGWSDTNNVLFSKAQIRIIDANGQVLKESSFFPGNRGGWFSSIELANDGGYILGGASNTNSNIKMYAVKTDSLLQANPIGIISKGNEISESFTLFQNFPNPFNPVTTIRFDIPPSKGARGMTVSLKIYDVTGKEVIGMTEENLAGSYSVTFDGTNFASGLYIYKIEVRQAGSTTGSFSDTKKMVLLK